MHLPSLDTADKYPDSSKISVLFQGKENKNQNIPNEIENTEFQGKLEHIEESE